LALTQLTESVCQHIAQKQPKKPLVISVHGPPGVGKTYTHWWLARALYNQQPSLDLDCPGIHCRGYKVSAEESSLSTHILLHLAQLASGLANQHSGMNAAAVGGMRHQCTLAYAWRMPADIAVIGCTCVRVEAQACAALLHLHNTAAGSGKP